MHSDYNVYRVRSRYNSDWGETGTEQEGRKIVMKAVTVSLMWNAQRSLDCQKREDIPANRKIKFSSAPIKAKYIFLVCFLELLSPPPGFFLVFGPNSM